MFTAGTLSPGSYFILTEQRKGDQKKRKGEVPLAWWPLLRVRGILQSNNINSVTPEKKYDGIEKHIKH